MQRDLFVESERFPIAGTFTISRGSKTEADVICCTIREDGFSGRGECVPYRRYGETIESVIASIEGVRGEIASGMDRGGLLRAMPAGAARNALDCALWDLEAKMSGKPVHAQISAIAPRPVETAFTLSLGTPEAMAARAAANAARPLLKVKIGGVNDIERIRAVVTAAPRSRIILDANEGWTDENIEANLAAAAELGIALIEQPLPAGRDEILRRIDHAVPICADESVHEASDLEKLTGLLRCGEYQARQGGRADCRHSAARSCPRARPVHHDRLHGRHIAGHGAGRAPGTGRRFRRSRRAAASCARRLAGLGLSRVDGVTARAGALGLSGPQARSVRFPRAQRQP